MPVTTAVQVTRIGLLSNFILPWRAKVTSGNDFSKSPVGEAARLTAVWANASDKVGFL